MVNTTLTSSWPLNPHKLNLDLFNDYDWLWVDKQDTLTPWTEPDILCLFEKLLQSSLISLFDSRSSWKNRNEIYSWVLSESDDNPFAFNNCCKFTGIDHDVIRDYVIMKFKPLLLTQLH